MDREEFAAVRKPLLDRAEQQIAPVVERALADLGQRLWFAPILRAAHAVFESVAISEGATPQVIDAAWEGYVDSLDDALAQTTSNSQASLITTMVATSATNAGTMAAIDGNEGALAEWVTMHDQDVRASHREADGQQITPGATFEVDGEKLHYPGEPVGPPSVWINCRCLVRPARGGEMATSVITAAAEEVDDEVLDDAPPVPDEADGMDVPWYGVLAPEGVPTGDKRKFAEGSLRYRDLPLPLRWQEIDQPGHDGSVVVARIDRIWLEDGLHKAEGVFHHNESAEKVIDLLASKMLRGVSVDLDDTAVEMQNDDGSRWEFDEDKPDDVPTMVVTDGRIASASIVSIPAFQEAFISIGRWDTAADEEHEPPALAASGEEEDDDEYAISEGKWDGSAARFTEEEWKRSCVLDKGEGEGKSRYGLPIKEPNGDLSRAGVHAAAGRINQVDAPDTAVSKAKAALRRAYGTLDEEVPDSLAAAALTDTFAPGTHDGPGWITNPRATARIRRYWVRGRGAAKIRWGQPNDFYRCRRQLAKYVQNPKWLAGLCANMHKEALGIWPGEHGEKKVAGAEVSGFNQVACTDCLDSLVSSAATRRPGQWFVDPELEGPTPITVDDDGRIYGHLATWGTCHIGMKGACVTPPKSYADYGYFRTGVVRTDLGDVPVGQITMGTGHADIRASHVDTVAHYDHTGMVVADVAAGEDEFGIWVAGALRPDLDDEEVAGLAAAALSGDWRSISGHLELVAALAVNVPGFPIPRVSLAASGFDQTALVAAGVVEHEQVDTTIQIDASHLDVEEFARKVVLAMDREAERRTRLDAFRATLREQGLERLRRNVEGSN